MLEIQNWQESVNHTAPAKHKQAKNVWHKVKLKKSYLQNTTECVNMLYKYKYTMMTSFSRQYYIRMLMLQPMSFGFRVLFTCCMIIPANWRLLIPPNYAIKLLQLQWGWLLWSLFEGICIIHLTSKSQVHQLVFNKHPSSFGHLQAVFFCTWQ